MIRKVEVDENGTIFHAYRIHDDHDPHNPNVGLEIDEAHAEVHEDMMQHLDNYAEMHIYDEEKGLRKRKKNECKPELIGNLEHFDELPPGFVKKNLGKSKMQKTDL